MINMADVTHPHTLVVRDKHLDWDLPADDLAICVCKGWCFVINKFSDLVMMMSTGFRPKR